MWQEIIIKSEISRIRLMLDCLLFDRLYISPSATTPGLRVKRNFSSRLLLFPMRDIIICNRLPDILPAADLPGIHVHFGFRRIPTSGMRDNCDLLSAFLQAAVSYSHRKKQ